MKNIKEIYRALLDGKKLVHRCGEFIVDIEDTKGFTFKIPEDWEIYDKHADLKKAYEEGAEIEYKDNDGVWCDAKNPTWWEDTEYRIKQSQWKMEPAEWWISPSGKITLANVSLPGENQRFGMVYHSKEQAEKARDQMKQSNPLRYWVSTMQDLDEGNFFILKNEQNGTYYIDTEYGRDSLCEVYMEEDTAEKICDALNNGKLKL